MYISAESVAFSVHNGYGYGVVPIGIQRPQTQPHLSEIYRVTGTIPSLVSLTFDPFIMQSKAPNRTLESWRLRQFYWMTPYSLPSDAVNLNDMIKCLRVRIGQELGITGFVEGMQVLYVEHLLSLCLKTLRNLPGNDDFAPYNLPVNDRTG